MVTKSLESKELHQTTYGDMLPEQKQIATEMVLFEYFNEPQNTPKDISERTGLLISVCARVLNKNIKEDVNLIALKNKYYTTV